MKKTLSILLILTSFSIHCHAKINLGIKLLSQNKRAIKILITATNTSEKDSILFYTPNKEDICMSLLSVYFIEQETKKIHEYFPCSWITDLDHINIVKANSTLLHPGQSYEFELNMKRKDISPFLKKNKYDIEVSLSYNYANFVSQLKHEIFKGDLKSNIIVISN
ncbi:hypothetical protein [Marinifilum caeruleilacunae]|uniref:Uncharacterized protein n=1 Tax=Marinifilum caeruleilacunae TaxID=2499076 RepID=A0ABX1X1A5_9BACT|nr:hypothetical protein [Marinifilum caeruleilacunae]NOU62001.1 hypothetical protein [Marinifilum caeruleilacunae]